MREPSGRSCSRSLTCGPSSSWLASFVEPRYVVVSFLTATTIALGSSLRSLVLPACGSFTSTPFWSMGVMTMKMMSRTIMMSAMGVTLMSAIGPPFLPPTAIAMGVLLVSQTGAPRDPGPSATARLGALLDEVVEELGAGVVHLHVEALDLAVEVVERPHRGDGHEEAERGGDQRLRDAGRDRGDAARAREGHARERVDDPEGRPEEADEGGGGADRGEAGEAPLQVGEVHRGGTVDRTLGRLDGAVAVALGFAGLDLVLPLLQARLQDLREVGQLVLLAVGDVDRLLDLPLLQVAGHFRRVLARLQGGLAVGPEPLDEDGDGVHGHDEEQEDDAPRNAPHVLGHGPDIELHFASSWTVSRALGPGA